METVGYYSLGRFVDGITTYYAVRLDLYKKPNLINRFFMKYLLGFVWTDKINTK